MEGKTFLKFAVSEPKAARDLAAALPRLECGKNIGVLSAPLSGASFNPGVVVIYCNTNQLRCLLSAEGRLLRAGVRAVPDLIVKNIQKAPAKRSWPGPFEFGQGGGENQTTKDWFVFTPPSMLANSFSSGSRSSAASREAPLPRSYGA